MMSDDGSPGFHLSAIRDLLLEAFTPASLEDLFRFASDPALNAVIRQFGAGDSLEEMTSEAIAYCERKLLLAELLAEVQRANPRQYAAHYPDLGPSAPPSVERLTLLGRAQARPLPWGGIALGLVLIAVVIATAYLLPALITPGPEPLTTYTPPPAETATPQKTPTREPSPTAAPTETAEPTKGPTLALSLSVKPSPTPFKVDHAFELEPGMIELTSHETAPSRMPTDVISKLIDIDRVFWVFVPGGPDLRVFNGFDIRLVVRNVGSEPIFVTVEDSYFSLVDELGRQVSEAEHFCCPAINEPLAEGELREIQVVFLMRPEWIGKGSPMYVTFHARGFFPVTHAAWKLPLPMYID